MNIVWLNKGSSSVACSVCAANKGSELLQVAQADQTYVYLSCGECGSVYPDHFDHHDDEVGGYQIGRAERDLGFKHYVEVGAGIESLLSPVLAVADKIEGSLLDVGCGFGFLVAAWEALGDGATKAQGIELASYGHWGREILNIDISHALLNENEHVKGNKYKYIFSGEVIEHVPDPALFLAQLSEFLDDDGILILTTPDADSVKASTNVPILLAALSPGAHQFIISERQLTLLLKQAGFGAAKVLKEGERLVAWASRKSLPQIKNDRKRNADLTIAFLEKLSSTENEWVRGGALYRRFRETVNRADFAAAVELDAQLTELVARQIGPENEWDRWVAVELKGLADKPDMLAGMPCYLGNYFYYKGMLALNHHGMAVAAIRHFNNSIEVNASWVNRAASLAQEASSLLPSTWFHLDLATAMLAKQNASRRTAIQGADAHQFTHFERRAKKDIRWPQRERRWWFQRRRDA